MKKIGLICLALTLALGMLGTGFAYWTETLTIDDQNCDTGDLHVKFQHPSSDDWSKYGVSNDIKEYKWGSPIRWDVDVGSCDIEVIDEHTTTVTLSDVYPGYQARVKLMMRNVGSTPAKIESVTLNITEDDKGLLDYVMVGGRMEVQTGPSSWTEIPIGYEPPKWGVPLAGFDVVLFKALKSTQTWPLETNWYVRFACEDPEEGSSLCFYILDGAPEQATLTFDLEFVWTQFNAS